MSRWLRIAVATALAVGFVGLGAGCSKPKTDLSSITEGQSFDMGSLRMNVLYDRFLNPADVEDSGYLQGAPPPPINTAYYGVFLLMQNEGDHDVPLPLQTGFTITDTTAARYQPVDTQNNFTFPFGQPLSPDDKVPTPSSIAASGPVEGSLILFLLNEGVSENRPLILSIRYVGEEADVTLDL
jgi:hypothetical protein